MGMLQLTGPMQITCNPFRQQQAKPRYTEKHTEGDGCQELPPSLGLHWVCRHIFLPTNTTMGERGGKKSILKFECDGNNHMQELFLHGQRHTFFTLSQHWTILLTTINNKTYNRIRSVLLVIFASAAHVFSFKTTTYLFFCLSEGHGSDLLTVTVVIWRWEESLQLFFFIHLNVYFDTFHSNRTPICYTHFTQKMSLFKFCTGYKIKIRFSA